MSRLVFRNLDLALDFPYVLPTANYRLSPKSQAGSETMSTVLREDLVNGLTKTLTVSGYRLCKIIYRFETLESNPKV